MSIEEFYKEVKKNAKENSELNQLYKKPKAEIKIYMPKFNVYNPDVLQQADILYMPKDGDYAFILVCVDLYDNRMDAEPIKKVDEDEVLQAFKKMFKRNYINFPIYISLDQGKEFKNPKIKKYFKDNKVNIRYTSSGRHRQNAVVERMNLTLAEILFKRMTSQELLSGEVSKEWVEDLPGLVKTLNKKANKKEPDILENEDNIPIYDDYSGNLLEIGQEVRVKLDKPVDAVKGNILYGGFRATDIRWSQKVYKITDLKLTPNQPPMYIVNDGKFIARTKNQLSVVKGNEKQPDAKFNRGVHKPRREGLRSNDDVELYSIIDKILDHKIENKKKYFLVKWKGRNTTNSWIHSSELSRTDDLRNLRAEYNDSLID
jgi:hypothetical protein